jgi:2-methylcitrate dehydratase PrpD
MGLEGARMKAAIGIACSMASAGIRANVGTETKPLHFGRAAENGLIAAQLARRGLESGEAPLDGDYGFLSVFSGGCFEEKLQEGFGRTLSIVAPGVSVKPYPSGILSHQAMDAMLDLVLREDLKPEEVERIDFYAGTNILKPLAYRFATDHMNAKFCIPALLSMIVLRRRAGKQEFTDDFVASPEMVRMQRLCAVHLDPQIEAQGFDRIRSRIEVTMNGGRRFIQHGDERYRGSPQWPISDDGLMEKLKAATDGVLLSAGQNRLIEAALHIDNADNMDVSGLSDLLP